MQEMIQENRKEYNLTVVLPDNTGKENIRKEITVGEGLRLSALAETYQAYYEDDIILAILNGKLRELNKKVDHNGELSFITVADRDGKRAYRRSMVFVLQKAVQKVWGKNALLKVCQSLGEGYYCEVYSEVRGCECGCEGEQPDPDESALTGAELAKARHKTFIFDRDLIRLSTCMDAMIEQDWPILKHHISTAKAEDIFESMGMMDKKALLYFRRSSRTNVYELDGTYGYFYGFMAPSTGILKSYQLEKYSSGLAITFPGAGSKTARPLHTSEKLFNTLEESHQWSRKLGVATIGDLNRAISEGRGQEIMLLQEAEMEDRIGDLAVLIAKDPAKKFIMIAGPSSSGKTSFCNRLSIQLIAKGKRPHPISLDDYYVDRVDTPKKADGTYDFECLEALDIKLFNENMTTLLQGGTIDMPTYNFKTGQRQYNGQKLTMGPDDILVIEGIHGLNDKLSYTLPAESKYKIYISALTQVNIDEHNLLPTTDGRLLRRMVRDARTRGTSAKSTISMWPSVREGEEKNIFPFQDSADYMFNSALIYELPVLKVYAEPLLFQIQKGEPEYFEAQRLLKLLDYVLPMPAEGISHNSLLREFAGGSCFNV